MLSAVCLVLIELNLNKADVFKYPCFPYGRYFISYQTFGASLRKINQFPPKLHSGLRNETSPSFLFPTIRSQFH